MMMRKLLVLLFAIFLMGCEKKQEKVSCGTGVCTLSFAMIVVDFTDKDGNAVDVQNFTAVNQRTKLSVLPPNKYILRVKGNYVITDDGMRDQFSNAGDTVLVTATLAGQTKTVTYKISGGCNCHVYKIAGKA
jgi:hypothetical protein